MFFKKLSTKEKYFQTIVCTFAVVGAVFVFVLIGTRTGVFNVAGSAKQRNAYFTGAIHNAFTEENISMQNLCQIQVLNTFAPVTSVAIYKSVTHGASDTLVSKMIESASNKFMNDSSFIKEMRLCATKNIKNISIPASAYAWADSEEWGVMKYAFTRDQEIINKAAKDSGISSRILLGGVIGEQFRFFGNRRESFKQYFEPLKMLASLSNISFGIAGIKPKTAEQIEQNLKNPSSPFYLGSEFENVLDYPDGANVEAERTKRITDSKDPYYSYLYVGLFMAQVQAQWERSGYSLYDRPDILATLYNLGFYYSKPKVDPQAGGAVVSVNGTEYTFGELAYQFYYSGELSELFPYDVVE